MMRCFADSFLVCLIWVLMLAPAWAENVELEAGGRIPDGLQFTDSLNQPVSFDQLSGEKGLVLLFFRSADWCQYCKKQLREWNDAAEKVQESGYALAALSYDKPEVLKRFADQHALKYRLLSDSDATIIKSFGILNDHFEPGSRFYGIPDPAIYVISANGEVQKVFREADYTDRPSVAEVLAALI